MSPLARRLKQRIREDGPLTVEQWMLACLADPDDGYYMTRDPLGRAGDFITAPEISQMFGELLGLWAAVVWHSMGSPGAVRLIELGPGRGTLMRDALRAAATMPGFTPALSVHMVETSPVLRKAQQETLADVPCPIAWHDALADVPDGPVLIFANEFLDALPIRQWVSHNNVWHERMVEHDGQSFIYATGAEIAPSHVPGFLKSVPEGLIFETAPAVEAVTGEIALRLGAQGGAALLIDYGHAERSVGETLQALKGHGFADPLADPGEQDLTAHVDFACAGDVARAAGAMAWGPITQGALLERLGIAARATKLLLNASKAQAEDIARARTRLVGDDDMGRLFKALALTHPALPAPPGFEMSGDN